MILFISLLFFVSLFLQTGKYFFLNDSYVNGIRIDYLAVSIYLSDLLSLVILVVYLSYVVGAGKQISSNLSKHRKIYLLMLAIAVINILSSSVEFITFFKIVKVVYLSMGIYVLTKYINKDTARHFFWTLIIIFFTSLLLGILQFLKGQSIGGIFYLLGERSMSITNVGIALMTVGGKEFLRPYSFFPHPNVFAGLMVMIILLAIKFAKLGAFFVTGRINSYLKLIIVVFFILFLGVIYFLSNTAFIALLGTVSLYLFVKIKLLNQYAPRFLISFILILNVIIGILSFSTPVELNKELSERAYLNRISLKYFLLSFSSSRGFGISPVKPELPEWKAKLSNEKYSYLYQPTHNILFLTFEEWGMVGFVGYGLVLYLLYKTWINKNYLNSAMIFFILLTGTMDHYWITLQQGTAVVILTIFLCLKDNKSHE